MNINEAYVALLNACQEYIGHTPNYHPGPAPSLASDTLEVHDVPS